MAHRDIVRDRDVTPILAAIARLNWVHAPSFVEVLTEWGPYVPPPLSPTTSEADEAYNNEMDEYRMQDQLAGEMLAAEQAEWMEAMELEEGGEGGTASHGFWTHGQRGLRRGGAWSWRTFERAIRWGWDIETINNFCTTHSTYSYHHCSTMA